MEAGAVGCSAWGRRGEVQRWRGGHLWRDGELFVSDGRNEGEGSCLYRWEEVATGNRIPTEDGIKIVSKSEIFGIDRFREREESVRGAEEEEDRPVTVARGPLVSRREREGGVRKLGFGPVTGRMGRARER